MRLHEAPHRIVHCRGIADPDDPDYEYQHHGNGIISMLRSAHVSDGCPSMRSAMERIAYGGLWEELVRSSRGDESWYRISAVRVRNALAEFYGYEAAGYVVDSLSFAIGPGFSPEAYSCLNYRCDDLLSRGRQGNAAARGIHPGSRHS